jgi:hypothetical protein
MKKSAKIWQFVQHKTRSAESWTWRRQSVDGAIEEISEPHDNFGKAVSDALARGFQPRKQHWLTKSGNWITHFAPGKGPYSVAVSQTLPASRKQKRVSPPLRTEARGNRISRGAGNVDVKSRRAKLLAAGNNQVPAGRPAPKRQV